MLANWQAVPVRQSLVIQGLAIDLCRPVVLKLFQTTAHLAKCTRPQRPPKLSYINL
jgi:hypothetical protein